MNPTKADLNALVSVLEDDTHADAEGMARAVWNTALERVSLHASYAVGIRAADTVSLYGPLLTYNNAQKYGGAWAAAGYSPFIYPLKPAIISTAADVNNDSEMCPLCGHYKTLHVDGNWRPYIAKVSDPLIPPGCGHFEKKTRCTCKETFGIFSSGRRKAA